MTEFFSTDFFENYSAKKGKKYYIFRFSSVSQGYLSLEVQQTETYNN